MVAEKAALRATLLWCVPARERGDCSDQRSCVNRLGEMQLETRVERLLTILFTCERGQCRRRHGRNRPTQRAQPSNEGVAIFAGHRDVGEQHVHAVLLQKVDRLGRRTCRQYSRLATLEVCRNHMPALVIVINDHDSHAA